MVSTVEEQRAAEWRENARLAARAHRQCMMREKQKLATRARRKNETAKQKALRNEQNRLRMRIRRRSATQEDLDKYNSLTQFGGLYNIETKEETNRRQDQDMERKRKHRAMMSGQERRAAAEYAKCRRDNETMEDMCVRLEQNRLQQKLRRRGKGRDGFVGTTDQIYKILDRLDSLAKFPRRLKTQSKPETRSEYKQRINKVKRRRRDLAAAYGHDNLRRKVMSYSMTTKARMEVTKARMKEWRQRNPVVEFNNNISYVRR